MGANHKQTKSDANTIAVAWGNLAKDDSFGGLTLAQFQQLLDDAGTKTGTLAALDANYADAMMKRDTAHATLSSAMLDVVDGVKGNTAKYGANSSLYKAMGYVPRDERSSGLTRKKGTTTATSTASKPSATLTGNVTADGLVVMTPTTASNATTTASTAPSNGSNAVTGSSKA